MITHISAVKIGYTELNPYVWTDRLRVIAQGQKQVIYINLLHYL